MKKRIINLLCHVFCLLMLAIPSVNASTIVFNTFGLDDAYNPSYALYATGPSSPYGKITSAASFTPSMSGTVSDIWIAVLKESGLNFLQIALMDDSSGQPGSILETWTISGQLGSYGNPLPHVTGAGTTAISKGVTYWLVLSATENTAAYWCHTSAAGVYGYLGWRTPSGPWHLGSDAALAFRVAAETDTTPPSVSILNPLADVAVQDSILLTADASDSSGVASVSFFVRKPDGGNGVSIGMENLAGTFNSSTGHWERSFDSTQLQDGNYIVLAKVIDTKSNVKWSDVVPFRIANFVTTDLLPATPSSKAGRTMPVKFTLKVSASIDPDMPFIYNEGLEIIIYKASDPGNILQTSHYGSGSTDYRIQSSPELYITNFKTLKAPTDYVAKIWRISDNFLIGSFTFKTIK